MNRKVQLKVIKADGTVEQYLHTKVLGTISNALDLAGCFDIFIAEQLSGAVTFHLYALKAKTVTSGEIFGMIIAALSSTGNEAAAQALVEFHNLMRIKRNRLEVVDIDINSLQDAELLDREAAAGRWNKSLIVNDLIKRHHFQRQIARTIAAMAEEKIFAMNLSLVTTGLIKQIVFSEIASITRAQSRLLSA
ncbi:MAG: hypothetical protein PHF37_00830 [Phycisphaerae bacterium]|nr:hypothetical protein [Phycisphaerae bacterium]